MTISPLTLYNMENVPGWRLDAMLELAYYERSELAIQRIKAELNRRRREVDTCELTAKKS